jgi:cell division initiation protein
MHITPLDIQQKRFRATFRGLDRAEVDAFLNIVASEFEKLISESNQLRDDQHRSRKLIEEYRERERSLKETMLTAQRVTEEIKDNAKKEADIIIGRAELEAEKIIENAQDRLTELLGDIAELKRQRAQFLAQIKGVVDTHHKLIKVAEDEEERGRGVEDNLAVMRRPQPQAASPQAVEESGSTEVPRQLVR